MTTTGWDANVGSWSLTSTSAARTLPGANGLRFGPDGLLYNASAYGSTLSRLDVDSGHLEILSHDDPDRSVTPDDLAFDANGTLLLTECMDARVVAFEAGRPRVVQRGVVGANGIATYADRIFVSEFLPQGRVLEIFLDDRPPVVLAEALPGPNGMCVADDRRIYVASVFTGEVLRVPIDGGPVDVAARGLASPGSVRGGPDGMLYISEGGSGAVTMLDPLRQTVATVAQGPPGIDSLDLDPSGRIFVSYYIDGRVLELFRDGGHREILGPGLLAPYGLAFLNGDVHVADGLGAAVITEGGAVERRGKFTDPGFPGYLRGLADARDRRLLATTSEGRIARYDPDRVECEILADGLSEPSGVAAMADGSVVVAESSAGRVSSVGADGSRRALIEGMVRPMGVAATAEGHLYVTDEEAGEVVELAPDGRRSVLASGLTHPQGLVVTGHGLIVVDVGSKELVLVSRVDGNKHVIANDLPVGVPGGARRKTLNGLPEMIPGPVSEFAGVTTDDVGRVHVAGDAIGAVLVFERRDRAVADVDSPAPQVLP
jgi:sugar lactone lactonase YvrE